MQYPPNTVTGPVPATPAHAARPSTWSVALLTAVGAVLLVAIGLGIAALRSAEGPARSTPSSALFMKDGATTAGPSATRHP